MDLFRHVNNTIYFRYMEQARLEWLHAQGPQYADIDAEEGPVIANASCEFLAPLVYPGDIEVRMFLGKPGRTSIASFYEIWMHGCKFADGASRLVWINRRTRKSTPLPQSIVASLRTHGA